MPGKLVPFVILPCYSTFAIAAEESTDQMTWSTWAGMGVSGEAPAREAKGHLQAVPRKRWFRIKVVLPQSSGNPPLPPLWVDDVFEQDEP